MTPADRVQPMRYWLRLTPRALTSKPNRENLVAEEETIAHLSEAMFEEVRRLPRDQASKRPYAYGSVAHEELLTQDFHNDRATAVIKTVMEIVLARLGLGEPDS